MASLVKRSVGAIKDGMAFYVLCGTVFTLGFIVFVIPWLWHVLKRLFCRHDWHSHCGLYSAFDLQECWKCGKMR